MAGLGGVLAQALIGRAPYKRPPTLKQMIRWAYLRGGKTWRGAAKDLGVSESTLRLWRKGGKISEGKLSEIREKTAQHRAERIRKGNTDEGSARIQFEFDGRPRDYPMANLKLARGTLRTVQDRLMAGDTTAAVAAFLSGIGDPWYKDHFVAYEHLAHQGESADNDVSDYDDLVAEDLGYDDPTDDYYGPDAGYDDIAADELAAAADDDRDYEFSVSGAS